MFHSAHPTAFGTDTIIRIVVRHVCKVRTFHFAVLDLGAGRLGRDPGVLFFVAPKWDEITHDGDFAYLPPAMTSVRGEELLEKAFPDLASKSNIVLVVARPDGELTAEDKAVAMSPGRRCSRPSRARNRRSARC